MRLLRKVSLGKWNLDKAYDGGKIPADALTVDLKTTGNTLSFWRAADEEGERKAVLAIVSMQHHLDKLDIVAIDESELPSTSLKNSEGKSGFKHLDELHVDLVRLDHESHVAAAQIIGRKIAGNQVRRIRKSEMQHMLHAAVATDAQQGAGLHENLRKALGQA